jgi:hypothetical protein
MERRETPNFQRKTGNQNNINGLVFLGFFDFHGDNGGSNPLGDAKLAY